MMSVFENYQSNISKIVKEIDLKAVGLLAEKIYDCWLNDRQVFICGNGGSSGNAIHLANDFVYGIQKNSSKSGLRIHALGANTSIITCLANDEGYEHIYSHQISTYADAGDLLIVLSGSGNSPNIIKALETAKKINVTTAAITGFDGGKAKKMAEISIHAQIHDMQISEDMQVIVGHMIMQWLFKNPV